MKPGSFSRNRKNYAPVIQRIFETVAFGSGKHFKNSVILLLTGGGKSEVL